MTGLVTEPIAASCNTNRDATKGKVKAMSETLDMATRLRNAANAKRTKSQNRVSSTTLLAKVVDFLNDNDDEFRAVDNIMPSAKHSAIATRFRNIITENKLDELVYPVIDSDHVYLVKLVSNES